MSAQPIEKRRLAASHPAALVRAAVTIPTTASRWSVVNRQRSPAAFVVWTNEQEVARSLIFA